MSGKVSIEVYNLHGSGFRYEIDVGMKIEDLIKHIVFTHPCFVETKTFSPRLVDLKNTRLIHNGKTLDSSKTLEEYIEFQYKSKNSSPYKMHILVKGGLITPENIDEYESMSGPHLTKKTTNPIEIRNPSWSNQRTSIIMDKEPSKSFPGTNSFLESQINRMERRQRMDSLRQVSDSINDISNFIKDISDEPKTSENCQQFDRLEKILQILSCIDTKLDKLIELGTITPQFGVSPQNYGSSPNMNSNFSPPNNYGSSPSSNYGYGFSPVGYSGPMTPGSYKENN